MQVIGIKRAVKHSPSHISNDATIFQMVAEQLKAAGTVLKTFHEHEFLKAAYSPDLLKGQDTRLIFSMSRNPEVLSRLIRIEAQPGNTVTMINSPTGIQHCFRSNITKILLEHHIPTAPSRILPTTGYDGITLTDLDQGHGLWLKRGDFHAIIKEDVVYAENPEKAAEYLNAFASRGIGEVVVSTHLEGDLIKFYGVQGTDFFHWLYPYDKGHYKYKDFQAINGQTRYFDFDADRLKTIAGKTAVQADVPIYGGDAVINDKGEIAIIDFNDWPSFAPCRDAAAKAITDRLLQALNTPVPAVAAGNSASTAAINTNATRPAHKQPQTENNNHDKSQNMRVRSAPFAKK